MFKYLITLLKDNNDINITNDNLNTTVTNFNDLTSLLLNTKISNLDELVTKLNNLTVQTTNSIKPVVLIDNAVLVNSNSTIMLNVNCNCKFIKLNVLRLLALTKIDAKLYLK